MFRLFFKFIILDDFKCTITDFSQTNVQMRIPTRIYEF